jgi:hypothetical protein
LQAVVQGDVPLVARRSEEEAAMTAARVFWVGIFLIAFVLLYSFVD